MSQAPKDDHEPLYIKGLPSLVGRRAIPLRSFLIHFADPYERCEAFFEALARHATNDDLKRSRELMRRHVEEKLDSVGSGLAVLGMQASTDALKCLADHLVSPITPDANCVFSAGATVATFRAEIAGYEVATSRDR